MSQASCIDEVIRQVDAATQAERAGHKRIAVDINRRSAVGADWLRSSTSLKYFLVSTTDVAQCQTSVIYVSDSTHGRAVGLKVEFETSCAEGSEERVAEALCDDPNPGAVLVGKIKEWVHAHISRQPTAFLDAFFMAKAELESNLSARALAETGLNLNASIFLCGEENVVRNFQLGPIELMVQVRDYSGPLRLRLSAELVTGQEELLNAIAYRADGVSVEEFVRERALRYFAETVTLNQFYVQRDEVKTGLRSHLEEALHALGRRVQSFDLEFDGKVLNEPYEAQAEVEYRVPSHPEPLIIRDTAMMSIQNYASYLSADSPDLGAWFSENLTQVVQQTLYGKKYEDILLGLEPLTRELSNKMSFKASGIGCGIQQQLTLTSPHVEGWLKGFKLAVEETVETGLEGFYVRVRVNAAVILKQLQGVKHYLAHGLEIPKLMESKVLDEVRQTLLTVHPERLYASPWPTESGDEPVKLLLSRKVRELLTGDCDMEVISLSVEMPDTEFSTRLKNLRRETISFEAEVSSHSPRSTAPLIFYGDCQVEGVSRRGWEKVWTAGFDLDKLKGQLVNALKSGMETRPGVDLAYSNSESAERVKSEITHLVTEYALREFGLCVTVCNVRRKATQIEKSMRDAGLANELLRIEMVCKLEQHLIQLIANGGKEEEIVQVRKRIADLRSYSTVAAAPLVNEDWPPPATLFPEHAIIAEREASTHESRTTVPVSGL